MSKECTNLDRHVKNWMFCHSLCECKQKGQGSRFLKTQPPFTPSVGKWGLYFTCVCWKKTSVRYHMLVRINIANEVIFVTDETAKCVSTTRYRVEHNINYMKHKEVYWNCNVLITRVLLDTNRKILLQRLKVPRLSIMTISFSLRLRLPLPC